MENALININGQIFQNPQDKDKAQISVFDRGFLYGDSLYEVARSYDGKFLFLEDHLTRLEKSAGLCRMTLSQSVEFYQKEIYKTFQEFRARTGNSKAEAYCRIIVTRGVGKIGFGLSCIQTPTQYVIIMQPVETPTPDQCNQGLKLETSCRIRNNPKALDPAMKSGNYLNSLLAYLDAESHGFQDAILCNADGHVTEGTTFNVFYIRRGIIATPPLDIGILDGITRRHVIAVAQKLGYEVREVRFGAERMHEADEAFISSSVKEVFAITQLDQKKIGSGKRGKITQEIHQAYRQSIGEYIHAAQNRTQ